MLGDSVGIWFVVESDIAEVEKNKQILKFYGGFKGAICNTTIANSTRKKN
jgi:hypothetical protein